MRAPFLGRRSTPARRLFLFLVAMAVPSLVLVALGVLIVFQQEELSQKRLADSWRILIVEFERALSTRLEQLREESENSVVALAADVDEGRLVLPWERTRPPAAVESVAFIASLTDAERQEFATRNLDRAAAAAKSALALAASPQQKNRARLEVARVAAKRGDTALANATYVVILSEPLTHNRRGRRPVRVVRRGAPYCVGRCCRYATFD